MNFLSFFKDLQRKNPFLATLGWLNLLAFVVFLICMQQDQTQILGINRWIKPSKFAASVGIYLLTMILVLDILKKNKPKSVVYYGFLIGLSMLIENICIFLQALRGTTSHFNISTAFDGLVFQVMGIFILLNTLMLLLITLDFFRYRPKVSEDLLWAVRLGLVLLLFASFEAGLMLQINRHTTEIADGGKGLPYLNWSTQSGDLRIAHFIGLHALQILLILAYINKKVDFLRNKTAGILLVVLTGFGIFGLMAFTLWQALNGIPLIKA